MRKFIANTHDLQAELRRLLAYAEEAHPSRAVVASELRDLADRVAASDVKKEVLGAMADLLADGIKKLGKDEFEALLQAARWGTLHDDEDDKKVLKLKQMQSGLVGAVGRAAAQVRADAQRGKTEKGPMSLEAAKWWYDQTDAVQFTMSRQLLEAEAKKLGIKLDTKKLIK